MARNRTISPDFWTWEAIIDCKAMTRLLFIGLWNFADDFGVQPLRPRTIRMQVFPGDEIGNDAIRVMIEELASRKLVRIYEVDGQEYLSIVDWEQIQRVGKHAKRRYPPFASAQEGEGTAPVADPVAETPSRPAADIAAAEPPPSPQASTSPDPLREEKRKLLSTTSHLIASQISKPPSPVRPLNSGP